ncbi:MAG: hypothetical protein CME71_10595 [Halobacteriovorax sp.]|nr:hypothetical protein [Halobacteriovorax sp.]|tara:strand:- start:572 stop:1195 length:624 start_codon:yes stop_codon:yes gene_type:complete
MSHHTTSSKIKFYFDFLSPYSYLAWTWVRESDLNIEAVPVVLAQVIHHYETKGPAEIEPKRNYLWKHCLRSAKSRNIPFVMPAKLPFNSSLALRMAIAAKGDFKVIDALFRTAWEKGLDLGDPEIILNLPECSSLDEVASSKECRRELKQNVAQAIENKVFGTPTFLVGEELFWGDDSKRDLFNFLRGEDLLDQKQFKHFTESFGRE